MGLGCLKWSRFVLQFMSNLVLGYSTCILFNIPVTYRSKPSKHKINMKKNSSISHQLNNMNSEITILCARFLEIALALYKARLVAARYFKMSQNIHIHC